MRSGGPAAGDERKVSPVELVHVDGFAQRFHPVPPRVRHRVGPDVEVHVERVFGCAVVAAEPFVVFLSAVGLPVVLVFWRCPVAVCVSAGAPAAAQVAHLPVCAGDPITLFLARSEGVGLVSGGLHGGLDGEGDDVAGALPAMAETLALARVAHHLETHGIGEGSQAAHSPDSASFWVIDRSQALPSKAALRIDRTSAMVPNSISWPLSAGSTSSSFQQTLKVGSSPLAIDSRFAKLLMPPPPGT